MGAALGADGIEPRDIRSAEDVMNMAREVSQFNRETKESRFTDAVKRRIDKLDIALTDETERGTLHRAIRSAMGGNCSRWTGFRGAR